MRRPPSQPRPPQIDVKKVELGGTPWNPQWDQIIEKALPPEMLSKQVPRGVRRFCPRFHQMGETDKRAFWAYFFQALAGAEAGLNPNTSVSHTKAEVAKRDEVRGMGMRREGLLQLAYADQKRYGCDFNWQVDRALKPHDPAKTILQPKNNLECGVKILFNQIIVQHKPLLTRSGYWSPLHPDGPSLLAAMIGGEVTRPLSPEAWPRGDYHVILAVTNAGPTPVPVGRGHLALVVNRRGSPLPCSGASEPVVFPEVLMPGATAVASEPLAWGTAR